MQVCILFLRRVVAGLAPFLSGTLFIQKGVEMSPLSNSKVIVRIGHKCTEKSAPISRVKGYLAATELVKLYNSCTLAADPRLPSLNPQVRDMLQCLETDPDKFRYQNNGVLVAASSVDLSLDRDRAEIVFDPVDSKDSPRGILNGGHTAFSCLLFLMMRAAEMHDQVLTKIKNWDDLTIAWNHWRDEAIEVAQNLDITFHVPIEILYPGDGTSANEYDSMIHSIADARNNNCQLTDETKSNFVGMYEELKEAMPTDRIRELIEWRTNTPGTCIRVKDVVALACIPVYEAAKPLHDDESLHDFPNRLDLKQVYNSTAKCTDYFHRVYRAVAKPEGNLYKLCGANGRLIASAIRCTAEIIECYDWLEQNFPTAYNDANGRFNSLENVGRKCSTDSRQYFTKYFEVPIDTKFSDALFIPILVGLRRLLEINDEGCLFWKIDPIDFLKRNLPLLMRTYKGTLKDNGNDSRLLARSETAYSLVYETFGMILELEALKVSS